MKKYNIFIYYFISLIFMEFVFKLLILDNILNISLINTLIYNIFISFVFTMFTKLFKPKTNKTLSIIILCLCSLWFSSEYVCKDYFDFYISWNLFGVADQMNDFVSKCVIETLKRIIEILIFFIPSIIIIIFNKKIDYSRFQIKDLIIITLLSAVSYLLFLSSLSIEKNDYHSNYKLYSKINNISLNIENLGIMNTFMLDTKRKIIGFEEEIVIQKNKKEIKEETTEEEIVYEYNNLDINFNELITKENDVIIKNMHEYFDNEEGTLKNEYTEMFKDKNLILFMAESFSDIAVNETLTPTLYKLVNSGFKFNNFYTPTIYSTIGGEFQELTGLYASNVSSLNTFRDGKNYFPYGIGNVFKKLDYNTYAYHNNSYVFQNRNKYLKSLGFDNFKACNNGLEKLINCKEWPQSDFDMINATINDYIDNDKFMVFYATVSGHAGYTWNGNKMAKKNKEEALSANLNYSEGPYSYLGAQMELDKALKFLIEKLEENNKLDNTVIALVGDHYPYELTIEQINEISSYKKDEIIGVNKSNFILWNNLMDTVEVDKVASQIDIIPTLYNLFGIQYDSRLYSGNDILSPEEGLAIFANRSWVSDYGTYYANTKEFVLKKGKKVSIDYVENMNQYIDNLVNMSKLIIDKNYYKKIFD